MIRSRFSDDGCSLRTRKREDTRRSLTEAAYALVRDSGFEGLTAEAVADRAGVSRRTFFNYFPSVESVLTASVAEFFSLIGACLEARPRDEDVLDSALAVITDPGDDTLVERIARAGRRRRRVTARAWPHPRRAAHLARLARGLAARAPARGQLRPPRRDLRLDAGRRRRGVVPRVGALGGPAAPHDQVPSVQDNLAATIAQLRVGLDPTRPAPTIGATAAVGASS